MRASQASDHGQLGQAGRLGVQMALPWSTSLDVSYVGNHGYNLMGAFQGGSTVNLNAIDIEGAMAQVEGTARSMGLDVV